MLRSLLTVALLSSAVFAGCLDPAEPGAGLEAPDVSALLVPTTQPLWKDPETTPHPKFNFPTLSHPPTDLEANKWLKPIPAIELPTPVKGLQHVAKVQGATSGAGMSLIGSLAILPANPTRIVDISDPAHPKAIGEYPRSSRGSDTIVYPDGRIIMVLATGNANLPVVDISDPTKPVELSVITTGGTHKVDVVPGTPIVYNSARGEIYDLTDPAEPKDTGNRMPATCHRTYFYNDPARNFFRAYCAGYQFTHIWDTADPAKPTLINSIPMWHARKDLPPSSVTPVTFSHFSIASHDAKILIVGDEMGGGALAACTGHASTPLRDASVPTGALWFYDISDEKNAVLKGWISPRAHFISNPPAVEPGRTPVPVATAIGCTAHHGRLVPDPEGKRHLLAMGYYGAGVVLVDFTDPASPKILDQFQQTTSVWEAWYYNGYVFTGDGLRGLDAIKFR